MAKTRVQITDVTLRDAHQSLIATRMRTEDMLPACPDLDAIGFWSLEAWGGATFDACLRFLKEDPWERLRLLKAALPRTRIQMLLRGQNLLGYRHYADDVVRAFVAKAATNGVDVFRIFDAMNDTRNLRVAIEAVLESGKHAEGTICYTTSPIHNVAMFVAMARELEAMGCQTIAIKDMAGLLTPTKTTALVKALVKAIKVPLHLHSHSTSGLAAICQWKAIENGCYLVDTALSSFADGTSHPPTESLVAALAGTPHDTGLDLDRLERINAYFREVRKRYHQFESDYTGVDSRVHVNQVPGGMISNLANQLREQGALARMDEVLLEIPRVRADLGYPPLVTPTSQIVGTQAVLNVLTGQRYKSITNEVKLYLQGRYGAPPGSVDSRVRRLGIGNQLVITHRPADDIPPEMAKLRAEIGDLAKSEEDILTYAMFPEVGRQFLEERAAGTLRPEELLPPPEAQAAPCHLAPTDFNITMHGETYNIKIRGAGHKNEEQRPFYVYVDGMPEEIMVETMGIVPTDSGGDLREPSAAAAGVPGANPRRPKASKAGDVTSAMPGTVVDVLVTVGQVLKAGDPVLVIEAMKMENEVPAPIKGTVKSIHVKKGDNVNPNEALVEIG
ncbi:sodium-extruding oxaloacetate decarboxylase subunit alpha [Acidiferrobacter sp.]|uniref:sodium-extruding oxaloacetate decarboxylase subunit alpha n=1 Tax=Acidiferrobacter sp. TaxID=1872107 RepID=UPI00261099EC|nr:sodium-extruding oxaloacetate decarboxylase subunit alpha [Acidiferrobacter sp.]